VGALALLMTVLPFFLIAQETEEPKPEKEKKNSTFEPYWFINLNLGALLYYGDIASIDQEGEKVSTIPKTKDWMLGYGGLVGWQITPLWGLRLQYLGGKLQGTQNVDHEIVWWWDSTDPWPASYTGLEDLDDPADPNFGDPYGAVGLKYKWKYESDYFHNPMLNATLNLSHLIGGYNPERVVNFKLIAGIGVVFTQGMLTDQETGSLIDPGTLNPEALDHLSEPPDPTTGIGGRDDELYYPDNVVTFNVPLGLGVDFRVSDQFEINLENIFCGTGSDAIDNFKDDAGNAFFNNDMYNYTSLGLTYKFGQGDNLKKMIERYDEVKYEVTPDPLVNTCTDIPVTIKGTFPEKYFNKKAAMQFAPVLVWEGGSYQLDPVYLQGEKVLGEGKVIPYYTGGSFEYTTTIPYQPGMEYSDLKVDPVIYIVKGGTLEPKTRTEILEGYSKTAVLEERKMADGVIMPKKVMHDEELLYADCPSSQKLGMDCKEYYEKETIISKEAVIYFIVDRYDLNWNMSLNKDPNAKAQLDAFKQFLAQGWKIKDIDIDAWASPEGEESRNIGLSENRSKTGHKYLIDLFKKMAKEKDSKMVLADPEKEVKYNVKAHGEDWDGFMKAVEASSMKDKATILNVVRSQPDVAKREQEIRNMSLIYKEIAENILPPLRRTVMKANLYEPKKTDEEIARLAMEDPTKLDNKELLYAATLTENLGTKEIILKKHIEMYPDDWKAYNNLGWVYLKQDKADEALPLLEKGNQLRAGNPMVLNNLGATWSKKEDYTKAETYYTEAQKVKAPVGYNMGICQAATCKYDEALKSFSGKSCLYNIAVAKFQKGDYKGAETELNCAPESTKVNYLKAVIGARTENSQMLFENLTKAVKDSEKCKTTAAKDREFVKYFEDPNFKALVQ
jgi:tetratricopeptide (TPR) repeat protein